MKKFTKKFLNTFPKYIPNKDYTESNAKRAEKKVGIKRKMWFEFSSFYKTNLARSLADKKIYEIDIRQVMNMCFLAGFVCGWAEKNRKIK